MVIANSDSQSGCPGLYLYQETGNSGIPQSILRPGYGLDSPAFESRQGQEIFLFLQTSIPAVRPTQSPIQWAPGFFAGNIAAGT